MLKRSIENIDQKEYKNHRTWVDLEDIAPVMVRAILASEDGRFMEHHGIDFEDLKNKYDAMTDLNTRHVSGVVVTALSQVKFNWVAREVVRVYSSLGLGITGGKFDDLSDAYLAGQAVLLGVSVGRRLLKQKLPKAA